MPDKQPNASTLRVRAHTSRGDIDLAAKMLTAGAEAASAFTAHRQQSGVHLLLKGDRDYYVVVSKSLDAHERERLQLLVGQGVDAVFAGRSPVRRRLAELAIVAAHAPAAPAHTATPPTPATPAHPAAPATPATPATPAAPAAPVAPAPAALDLNAGIYGAAPLFLLADGTLADKATGPASQGMAALPVLVAAARWVSTRRTSTFERLFPPSAFHPDEAPRPEHLTAAQAEHLLAQLKGALVAAAVGSPAAAADATSAAQLRSAVLTVLSHIVATVRKDASFRTAADTAATAILELIDKEQGHATARPALRSHAIQLLQMRAPGLSASARQRAGELLKTLIREAPPYAQLKSVWRFAMCSAYDFHDGECDIFIQKYGFKEIPMPADAPKSPSLGQPYRVLEAPFKNPSGQPIQIFARTATPRDENSEMAVAGFVGLLINRHAQLGSFDMQASSTNVQQAGYKLMINSQCAGLTTRFAIAKMFPEADIYSSWDSTYFRTDPKTGKVTASEGIDCFIAMLTGMSRSEGHAQLSDRMRAVQWYHEQGQASTSFSQFVGPAHPLVVARYADVNQDGRADYYDGFLDFTLKEIKSDLENSATPRDPGAAATQIGGDAAKGLNWAAGSMNRVTQYSDLWRGLPGNSELFYIFAAGGFFSHHEPPRDVAVGKNDPNSDLGLLPSVARYDQEPDEKGKPQLSVEVMFHSYLAHAAWELKRLLCAAEAMRRALDIGILPPTDLLSTPQGQRGAILLMLAGLLEFPADQNFIDGLWNIALRMLNLPQISRSLVRGCITNADHDASNYYGSVRGLRQLMGDGTDKNPGDLKKSDAVAYSKLASLDPKVGRALPLTLAK